ncbi:MAG: hypothetical protein AB7F31_03330 [Parachlamydiales bacterium]
MTALTALQHVQNAALTLGLRGPALAAQLAAVGAGLEAGIKVAGIIASPIGGEYLSNYFTAKFAKDQEGKWVIDNTNGERTLGGRAFEAIHGAEVIAAIRPFKEKSIAHNLLTFAGLGVLSVGALQLVHLAGGQPHWLYNSIAEKLGFTLRLTEVSPWSQIKVSIGQLKDLWNSRAAA